MLVRCRFKSGRRPALQFVRPSWGSAQISDYVANTIVLPLRLTVRGGRDHEPAEKLTATHSPGKTRKLLEVGQAFFKLGLISFGGPVRLCLAANMWSCPVAGRGRPTGVDCGRCVSGAIWRGAGGAGAFVHVCRISRHGHESRRECLGERTVVFARHFSTGVAADYGCVAVLAATARESLVAGRVARGECSGGRDSVGGAGQSGVEGRRAGIGGCRCGNPALCLTALGEIAAVLVVIVAAVVGQWFLPRAM